MPNREHWKAMLPIIQAYVKGGEIDVLFGERWVDGSQGDTFCFDQPPSHYRVAKRDWAWACEQMLAGNAVTASHMGRRTLSFMGGVLSSRVEARDFLATDYRIARREES